MATSDQRQLNHTLAHYWLLDQRFNDEAVLMALVSRPGVLSDAPGMN
jgi:hypothetical protein